jgi:hypothetical protein
MSNSIEILTNEIPTNEILPTVVNETEKIKKTRGRPRKIIQQAIEIIEPEIIIQKVKKEPFSNKVYYEKHKDKFKNYYEIRKQKNKEDSEINKVVYDVARENYNMSLALGLPLELINYITAKKTIDKNLTYMAKIENNKIILTEKTTLTTNTTLTINNNFTINTKKYDSDNDSDTETQLQKSNASSHRSYFDYSDVFADYDKIHHDV